MDEKRRAVDVERLEKRLGSLKRIRDPFEKRMNEAIRYVLPYQHSMDPDADASDYEDNRYDATASEAATSLADGMLGNLSPPTVEWFSFSAVVNELNDLPHIREYFQEVNERVREAINRTNFYDIAPTIYKHAVALETVSAMIGKDPDTGTAVLSVIPPREIYIANDAYGRVEAVYREYKLTAEQAANLWPEALDKMSDSLRTALDQNPDAEYKFVTVVQKRHNRNPELQDVLNMPWAGYTFQSGQKELIEETGFRTIPIPTWRWEVRGRDPYGYGLTTEAMPDIKTLNEIVRTYLAVGQKFADPPTYFPEQMADDDEYSTEAGFVGFYKDPGQLPIQLPPQGSLASIERSVTMWQEKIRSIYKVRYFMMLMQLEQPGRTAYEIRERKIEKITAMGSIVGRCQQEFLTPFLARMFWIEQDAGRLPDPPQELVDSGMMVDFIGPFAQAQKEVTETTGIVSAIENSLPILQIFPEARMKFNPEKIIDDIMVAANMPEKNFATEEEYAQRQAAAQQQAAEAAAAEKLKALGGAAPAFTNTPQDNSIASQILGG